MNHFSKKHALLCKFAVSNITIYMKNKEEFDHSFSQKLIEWYGAHKRDLPWRNTKDPYKIWLSEIILQQTRVNQGMEYFIRMVTRFPNVQALAGADEDEVLKYWQGLGYYTRARNLHASAKKIVSDLGGKMPTEYETLLKLKGIGEYTAAAIASFAANKPHPVVDGNVYRFLSRYFMIFDPIDTGKGKKTFTEIAEKLIDKDQAGLFNQAIMEFGALQCIPGQPDCHSCTFSGSCMAWSERKVTLLPQKQGKVKIQKRYFHYFHITDGSYTYIYKRSQKDIWHNLYEFPMIETDMVMDFEQLQQTDKFKETFADTDNFHFKLHTSNKKHVLTHRIIYATFYEVTIKEKKNLPDKFIEINENDINKYAVHRLISEYIS